MNTAQKHSRKSLTRRNSSLPTGANAPEPLDQSPHMNMTPASPVPPLLGDHHQATEGALPAEKLRALAHLFGLHCMTCWGTSFMANDARSVFLIDLHLLFQNDGIHNLTPAVAQNRCGGDLRGECAGDHAGTGTQCPISYRGGTTAIAAVAARVRARNFTDAHPCIEAGVRLCHAATTACRAGHIDSCEDASALGRRHIPDGSRFIAKDAK